MLIMKKKVKKQLKLENNKANDMCIQKNMKHKISGNNQITPFNF